MKMKFIIPMLSTMLASGVAHSASVEDRLSELEVKQDMQVVKFGGRFFSSYDNVEYQTRSSSTGNYTTDTLDLFRLQFSLNLDANLSPKLKFYGRYTTSKYFNHFSRDDAEFGSTKNTSINNSGSRDLAIADTFDAGPTTYLERAYFNYFMNDYLVFTAGRLPTVDGPPLHWEDNVSREGTYSHLAYSNVLDGVATTVNLNKFMPTDHSLNFRFIYTPFSNVGNSIVAGGVLPTGNPGSIATKTGGKMDSISPLYVGMAEYSLKGQHFNDVLVLAQVLVGNNLFYGRSSTYGEIRVDYNTYSLYSHITNLMNWGLDLSATAFMSTTTNNTVFAALGGAYSAVKDVTKYGHALLLSSHYAIPVSMLNNPGAGMEYIYGDKNFNKIDPVSHDPEGFYSTRGYGYHFYYSQPIETGLKLRFGYITKTDKYARGDVLGDVTDAKIRNNKVKNIYAQVRLDF